MVTPKEESQEERRAASAPILQPKPKKKSDADEGSPLLHETPAWEVDELESMHRGEETVD